MEFNGLFYALIDGIFFKIVFFLFLAMEREREREFRGELNIFESGLIVYDFS